MQRVGVLHSHITPTVRAQSRPPGTNCGGAFSPVWTAKVSITCHLLCQCGASGDALASNTRYPYVSSLVWISSSCGSVKAFVSYSSARTHRAQIEGAHQREVESLGVEHQDVDVAAREAQPAEESANVHAR